MVDRPLLSRRQLLQLAGGGGLALTALGLAGCSPAGPRLLGTRGELPTAWTSRLPRAWRVQLLDEPAAVAAALSPDAAPRGGAGSRGEAPRPALLQLGDGWASGLRRDALQPIGTPALLARLDPLAVPVSRLFGPEGSPALAFPWSANPWLLLLRDRPDLAQRAAEGWGLLLDPSLRGRLVLPASVRLNLALVNEDPERLKQLRQQALAFDDRDGLSLLLNGHAEAAVLPRQRVIPLLRRDPRLAVVQPAEGGPVSWNLLLSAAGAPPAPLEWLGEILEPPLLSTLLAAGWVPPLPQQALESAVARFPGALRPVLLPPAAVRSRWRDLPPLSEPERSRLQALWDGAAPPSLQS